MDYKDCRILVALPCYDGRPDGRFQTSWSKLVRWATEVGMHMTLSQINNESLLPRARNQGLSAFLKAKDFFTHILFLDSDMGFEPYRLMRLIQSDLDFVGAPGPTKWIHWEYLADSILLGKDPQVATLRYAVNFIGGEKVETNDGFAEVSEMGCCFCLIKRDAILKMIESYPELQCKNMSWVNGEPSDSRYTYAMFDTYVGDDGTYTECDHAFMARWRAIGGKVHADMTSDLAHCGRYEFRGDMAQQFFGRKHHAAGLNATQTPWGATWDHLLLPEEPLEPMEDMKFHVTIIRPEGNRFPLCFMETARMIQNGLQDLGYDCTRRENRLEEDRINIVFGWHMWQKEHPREAIKKYRIILYQGEQIAPGGRQMPDWYFRSMNEAMAVWDYSMENVAMLDHHGIASQYVPPSWHPSSQVIPYAGTEKDIDVLFCGVMNLRREFMLKLLGSVCKTQALVDVWGPERDEIIARAKLLINIHYYPAETLELLRISHLLASGVPVLSEESDSNPYEDGIEMVPYGKLLPSVINLLADDDRRSKLAQRGMEKFREITMVNVLEEAIGAMVSADEVVT